VGLWLVGAFGGVGSTACLGLAAVNRGLIDGTGLVTALPLFEALPLEPLDHFVVGGHDIRRTSFAQAARELHQRSNVFDGPLLEACLPDLDQWSANIRTGTVLNAGDTIVALAELPAAQAAETCCAAIKRIQSDLRDFCDTHRLERVVVANVA